MHRVILIVAITLMTTTEGGVLNSTVRLKPTEAESRQVDRKYKLPMAIESLFKIRIGVNKFYQLVDGVGNNGVLR